MEKTPMKRLILYLATITLAACLPTGLFSSFTGNLTPVPTCRSLDVTGAPGVTYPVVFTRELPYRLIAGMTYRIEFTGGVIIMPAAFSCDEYFTALPPQFATAEATTREVSLTLYGNRLTSQQCGYECTLEFTIPSDFPPGKYPIIFASSPYFRLFQESYQVEVLPAGS
jgi:hypothetical protein